MIIRDKEMLYSDDIGQAFTWRSGACIVIQVTCDASTWAFYTGKRVHLRAAYFVVSDRIKTPIKSGVIALKDEVSARRAITEFGGKGPLDFDEMQELFH